MLLSVTSWIESSDISSSTCSTETSPSGGRVGEAETLRLEATQTHPARSSDSQISFSGVPSHDGSSHAIIRGQHGQPSMNLPDIIPSLWRQR